MSITPKLKAEETQNSVYKISPYQDDEDSDFQGSIYCENAPFRSICTDKNEYIRMRTDTKLLPAYQESMNKCTEFSMLCQETTLETKLLIFGGGIAAGIIIVLVAEKVLKSGQAPLIQFSF